MTLKWFFLPRSNRKALSMVLKNPHYPNIPTVVWNASLILCAGECVPSCTYCRYQTIFTVLSDAGVTSFSFVDMLDWCLFNCSTSRRRQNKKKSVDVNMNTCLCWPLTQIIALLQVSALLKDFLETVIVFMPTIEWKWYICVVCVDTNTNNPPTNIIICLWGRNKKRKNIAILNLSHRRSSARVWVCVCFQWGCSVRTF